MDYLTTISGRYGADYIAEFKFLLETYAPKAKRFLEWGSGETTSALCEIASKRPEAFVLSIDDNYEYQRRIADSLPMHSFLHLRCLDLQGPSRSQSDQEPSYSSYPYFMKLEFDLIFVDGRRRAECALTATQAISRDGIVVIHDWRRSRYEIIRVLFDVLHEGDQFLVLRSKLARSKAAANTNEKRAVVIPVNGARAEREFSITFPFAENYARNIGAEIFVVGKSSSAAPHKLKSEALEVARAFDRTLLIDADVLIRPDSPDIFEIVPSDALGAFPEGAYVPRDQWCDELNLLYNPKTDLLPHEYFNSGVMVLSQANYRVLEALQTGTIFGQPQFEQGLLNIMRIEDDIPLFPLPPDLNCMPFVSTPHNDWRYAFFVHMAGSGKGPPLYSELWQDIAGDRKVFSRKTFKKSDVRANLLLQTSQQIEGRDVKLIDATDFFYVGGQAMPIFDRHDNIVAFFPESGNAGSLSVYGPYVVLSGGHWRGKFLKSDLTEFFYPAATFDITANNGAEIICRPASWPDDGVFEFRLPEITSQVEFRIYRAGPSCGLSSLHLEKVSD